MGLGACAVEGLVHRVNRPTAAAWAGRRVVLTGHTGFKGSWLALWLSRLGADVTGIGLAPSTSPSLCESAAVESLVTESVRTDLRRADDTCRVIREHDPEVVFHLAAQSLVRESYVDPVGTFATNVMATVNVLEAVRECPSTRVVIIVTTDKVYLNREWHHPYREDEPLGGHDPYSASKAAAELAVSSYRSSYLAEAGVALSSVRAGNVIGGGDWAADRLVPDLMRGWLSSETVRIRRPDAVRPWQHVLDPLCGYLCLAEATMRDPSLADAYNLGPDATSMATVRDVADLARQAFDAADVEYDTDASGPHEAGLLLLDSSRAAEAWGYQPRWSLVEAVERTTRWYRAFASGQDARGLCEDDIAAYEMAR